MNTNEKDTQAVLDSLQQWMGSLDAGDLETMLKTCDPEAITCNEHSPTTIGIDAIREKYAPRIAHATFSSTFETEYVKVYGDMAIIIGHFGVTTTNKESGEQGGGEGRLVLVYRKHEDGSWKMILDVDNNAPK